MGKNEQLTSLRDALKRNKLEMNLTSVGNYLVKYISDDYLEKTLINPVFERALWYCMCNSNADRDLIISKLQEYLYVKHHIPPKDTDELIEYALYLSGIDFQLNKIHLTYGETDYTEGDINKYKWVLLVGLVVVILLVVATNRSCSRHSNTKNRFPYVTHTSCNISKAIDINTMDCELEKRTLCFNQLI